MKREQNEREDALMAFRFTEDAWQKYMWKTHPGTDWRDGTHPYNMRRSMQGCIDYLERNRRFRASVINAAIDEEFESWAEANGYQERSMETIGEYAQTLSDSELLRLLKKHGYQMTYEVNAIPVMFWAVRRVKGPTHLKMQISVLELEDYLEGIFGKGNIYLPGMIVKPETYFGMDYELAEDAVRYFRTGEKTVRSRYLKQTYPKGGVNMGYVMIPFVVRHEETRVRFTFKDLSDPNDPLNLAWRFTADRESLDRAGFRQIEDIAEHGVNETLNKEMSPFDFVRCFPTFISPEDTPEAMEDLRKGLREMASWMNAKTVVLH